MRYYYTVSVDTYNSDDWQKLRAAVDALKNPVLDDSVLLESTQLAYVHPPSRELSEEEVQALQNGAGSFNYQPHNNAAENLGYGRNRRRRGSEGGILARTASEELVEHQYGSDSGSLTNNWVAGLPEYGRRMRSHTEPIMPLDSILNKRPSSGFSKAQTLPVGYSSPQQFESGDIAVSEKRESLAEIEKDGTNVPNQLSPPPSRGSTSQRTSISSPSAGPPPSNTIRPESGLGSPQASMTPNSKLIKIYMSRVQKGM